jgi:hypothetical protein
MTKHLAIQASARHIRFVKLFAGKVLDAHSLDLPSNETSARESLDSFFKTHSNLTQDEEAVSLAWSSIRSTLVPGNIFAESSADEIYRLCYGDTLESEVDYNRLAEHSMVHVYDIPLWIKRYFVVRFPRIVIQHEGTPALRKIMQAAFKLSAHLILHDDHFRLSIVRHNQLEYYGSFSIQSWEDVLYHLMFTLQQKEMTNKEGFIELISGADAPSDLSETLHKNLARIGELSKMEVRTHPEFLAESQLLCV